MPVFYFEAMDPRGEAVADVIEAGEEAQARRELSGRGLFVTKLRPASQAESLPSLPPGVRKVEGRDKRTITVALFLVAAAALAYGVWRSLGDWGGAATP